MRIERYHRFWAVYEADGGLLCLCVYKKGALAVTRRLLPPGHSPALPARPNPPQTVRERKEGYDATYTR